MADSDYDVDEEYDNDYAENYFDNGEGDDNDDLGGGGGDDGGGGEFVYFKSFVPALIFLQTMNESFQYHHHLAFCTI